MYYYEKDYIMRLIHGLVQALEYLYFGKKMEEKEDLSSVMEHGCRKDLDDLRRMIDEGAVNSAEDRLFGLLEAAPWDGGQKLALSISFYDMVNAKDDAFLTRAGFPREEILRGLEDALKTLGIELPEYLKIR